MQVLYDTAVHYCKVGKANGVGSAIAWATGEERGQRMAEVGVNGTLKLF